MAEKRPICLYSGKLKELASSDDIWGKAAILAAAAAAANAYTDGVVAGLSWKQMVRAATTTAGTLASSFENGDTIDGVTLVTGNRILIKDQADPKENGIYIVAASGAPTRATDADSGSELVNASVYVSEGTTLADTQWVCTTNATITIGATNITFTQFSGGGGPSDEYIQDLVGAMLSGNTETGISVDYQDSDGTIDFVVAKASGSEVDTGTEDAKFVTPKALADCHNVPDVAPGSSGNILSSNGTDWVSSTPSTIAGIPSGLFAAPRTSNTEDDEFEGAAQDAKWTKTNSAALESYDDHIRSAAYYRFNASSSDVSLKQNYANSGDFSITACVSVSMATNFHNFAMFISDSTEANYVEVQVLWNGQPVIRSCKNVATVFSQVTAISLSATNSTFPIHPFFLHIQRATNNWNVYYSWDAVHWSQIGSAIALTFTVHHFILQLGPGGAATKTHVVLHWFRRDWLTL